MLNPILFDAGNGCFQAESKPIKRRKIPVGFLKIDKSKCKQDGLCVKDCITAIIRIPEGGGYPYVSPKLESMCRVCGRCVAVCPSGALTNELVPKSNRGKSITYNYGRHLTAAPHSKLHPKR